MLCHKHLNIPIFEVETSTTKIRWSYRIYMAGRKATLNHVLEGEYEVACYFQDHTASPLQLVIDVERNNISLFWEPIQECLYVVRNLLHYVASGNSFVFKYLTMLSKLQKLYNVEFYVKLSRRLSRHSSYLQ
jgi:hypothetical protein